MKLTIREKRDWMIALLVAAVFGWREPVRMLGRIGKAFWLWTGFIGRDKKYVPPELAARRMEVCKRCFVYSPRFKTCGSPLATGQEDMGCYCYLLVKTNLANAQCWLDTALDSSAPSSSWINQGLPKTESET